MSANKPAIKAIASRVGAVLSAILLLSATSDSQTYTWCITCYQEVACEILGPYYSSQYVSCGSRRIEYSPPKPNDCELWTRKQRSCLQPYKAVWWENYMELKEDYTCYESGGCLPN